MSKLGVLYLFPTTLGESSLENVLPKYNSDLISEIRCFIVEDLRSARRFLKKCNTEINIDDIVFFELNQHTDPNTLNTFIEPLLKGYDLGLLSEAGCPAIADPGADIVAIAQRKSIKVVPLVGPSSILLSLMASGFNGQSFAFNGYLPIQTEERVKTVRKLEARAYSEDQSQLFIETPYRNMKMLDVLIKSLKPETLLCIAADISLSTEYIKTYSIKQWKSVSVELSKRPAIFIIYHP